MIEAALCAALLLASLLPPDTSRSGWHVIAPPAPLSEAPPSPSDATRQLWWWDAEVRVWRGHPASFIAETPQQMACDNYAYVSPDARSPMTVSVTETGASSP